ncbi:hypothetical protein NDU88_002707 [Pleurodeles waltl]|uniref:Uncharacterized protein n=1 Tax=Pleurodeles waltl TaxID=8319 RepID=A0AAV7WQA3_PLEWA|nr:hypothetical protein NDU88_002707 [Pleurodeles waltl]
MGGWEGKKEHGEGAGRKGKNQHGDAVVGEAEATWRRGGRERQEQHREGAGGRGGSNTEKGRAGEAEAKQRRGGQERQKQHREWGGWCRSNTRKALGTPGSLMLASLWSGSCHWECGPCGLAAQSYCYVYDEPGVRASQNQEGDENYYFEETHTGSFEQDLVQALDADVHQTVNDALAKATTPLKHHLYGFVQQQTWLPPAGALSEGSTNLPSKQFHSEAFEKFAASLANEHPYSMPAEPHAEELSDDSDASSSRGSSKGDLGPSRKRKAKTHHTSNTKQAKLLTFEPGEIIHPDLQLGSLLLKSLTM